ncbi:MAG: hypothetical protein KZQ99_22240 [Candidatus Thiodiazotropha sp. (ex Dulcina madagascariensis)]|nr:hypothetical protein [Candidatus Thiodiazotropha sp. (ex Dulcina madagascariensis)]
MSGHSNKKEAFSRVIIDAQLKAFSIPLLTTELQKVFDTHLASIFSVLNQQEAAQVDAESNFQSLLYRAFAGELMRQEA